MENIKVGCIPVRQTIKMNTKLYKIKKFIMDNKIGIIIGTISSALLITYTILITSFIQLIKVMQ